MTTRRLLLSLAAAALALLWIGVASAQAELEFEALQTVPRGGSEYEWTNLPQTPVDATQLAEDKIAMTVGGTTINCETATASSTLAEGSSPTLTLSPAYGGCKAGPFKAEVATKGCTFSVNNLAETGADAFTAQADIGCPPEGEILVTVFVFGTSSCLIHVYPQTSLKTIKVTNLTEASPASVTVKSEIETMKAVVTKGNLPCMVPPGSYTNAKFTGTTNVTATGTTGEVPPLPPWLVVRNYKKFHFLIGPEFTVVIGRAESPQEFTFDAGKVICIKADWKLVNPGAGAPFTTLSSHEPYKECEFNGVEKAEFLMAKFCEVTLKSGKQYGIPYRGLYTILCGANEFGEIKFANCTIRLFKQKGPGNTGWLDWVNYENLGALQARAIRAIMNVYGIEYEEVGPACEHLGTRKINGRLQGKVYFEGQNAFQTEQRPVWFELTK